MRLGRSTLTNLLALALSLATVAASCAAGSERDSSLDNVTQTTTSTTTLVPTPTSAPRDRAPMPTTTTTTSTTTTTAARATTTTSAPAITVGPTSSTPQPPPARSTPLPTLPAVSVVLDSAMPETNAAFEALARANAVASITVRRDGAPLLAQASGLLIDGTPATPDSPMLVASVSKIVTAVGIARLAEDGLLAIGEPVPWATIGLAPDPGWNDITVRDLLDHTSGMPVARTSWFGGGGDCRGFLPTLVDSAPQSHRGAWRYSNGNYCALGLLIEALTGQALDVALQALVFDPIGADGLHLSTDGLLPTDAPHGFDANRFSRLGGAGTLIVSTDDLTAVAAQLLPGDIATLRAPGVFVDQYGWGHTGTIDGAVSCLWVLENGRTTVAATIAGSTPAKGGDICDRVVPAVANDLGIGQGRPVRTP